jgi:CelD/BcsL family acetyltransferase involved in cellulose biosynthesis
MMPSHKNEPEGCEDLVAAELCVQTISDYSDFLQLEPIWNRLVESTAMDHPFLTHEWVRIWWDSFGADASLHILLLKAGTEPIAIAPFMLAHDRVYGFKMRRLRLIHNDHTPSCDFIMVRSAKEVYRAVWSSLLKQKEQWDVIEFPQLPAGSETREQLERLAAENGYLTGAWHSNNSPYVQLMGSWENYVKNLTKHHRSNINSRLNRLQKLGPANLELVSSQAELPTALEEGYRIEAAAWKGEAGTAIYSQPELREFYTAFAKMAAERGWLRLYFLNVNGERIAFDYCILYQNKLYSLKIGYDPKFASYSPCNLLKYLMMREAFELGLTESHFLGTDDKWKLDWTKQTRPYCCLFVFSPDLRGLFLHWAKFQLAPKLNHHRLYATFRKAAVATISLVRW